MIQILKRVLLLVLLMPCSAVAQDVEPEEKREEKGRQARFICSSVPEGLENPVTVLAGKEIIQLVISKYTASDPVKIPADGILRIVRKVPNPKDPAVPEFVTLAQASVPETATSSIIVLVPMAKPANGLIFHTKVQDITNVKGGDTMFLNITNLKIGVELGGQKIGIDPGQVKIHNPLGSATKVSLPISLSFYDTEKQRWALITASTVALYSTRRELCIFTWDDRFKRVDFESVTFPATN